MLQRIQNCRKEKGYDVTDRILVCIESNENIVRAIRQNEKYISEEVLANSITFNTLDMDFFEESIENENDVKLSLSKVD